MKRLHQLLRDAEALEGADWTVAYADCTRLRAVVWLHPSQQPAHGDWRKRPLLCVERAWRWGRGDDCVVIGVGCQRHQDPEPLWSGRLQGGGLASAQRALREVARDLAALLRWTDANPELGATYVHNYVELDLGDADLTVRMRWRPGGLRFDGHCWTHAPGAHLCTWEGDLAALLALLGAGASPSQPHTHGAVMTSTPRHACNGCGAPILFGALRSGKMIPIEPTKVLILPDPTAPSSVSGECATILARGQLLVGRLVPPRTPNAVEGPLVHRSRCPGAARTTASGAPVRGHRALPPERQIQVVGAAILRDGRCFAARRSVSMSLPLKWEFPGGKLELGEAPEAALIREITEELGIQIEVHDLLGVGVALASPGLRVHLSVYRASWRGGDLVLHEHDQSGWFTAAELAQLEWAAPDTPILPSVVALLPASLPLSQASQHRKN